MDELEKQLKLYKKYIGDFKRSGDQLLFYCPFCKYEKHRKFSVNIIDNIFHCWVCNKKGTSFSYLKSKGASKEELKLFYKSHKLYSQLPQNVSKPTDFTLQLPNDYRNLLDDNGMSTRKVYNYAISRGLTNYQIRYHNLGCSDLYTLTDYLLIPSYNCNGQVNYLQGRYINNDDIKKKHLNISKKKYGFTKNDIIPFELFVNWDEPIILVEGYFDLKIKFNCLPLLGSSLNEKSPIILKLIQSDCRKIYLMLDDDALYKSMQIIQTLTSYGFYVYFCNIHPYHEPSQLTNKEFDSLMKNATLLDYNNATNIMLKMEK